MPAGGASCTAFTPSAGYGTCTASISAGRVVENLALVTGCITALKTSEATVFNNAMVQIVADVSLNGSTTAAKQRSISSGRLSGVSGRVWHGGDSDRDHE